MKPTSPGSSPTHRACGPASPSQPASPAGSPAEGASRQGTLPDDAGLKPLGASFESPAKRPRMDAPKGASTSAQDPSPTYSQASVGGRPHVVDESTPEVVRNFLSQSLSHNRYDSEDHLRRRAASYLGHIEAENRLIQRADEALHDTGSAVFRQSAWINHLERGSWKAESLDDEDRERWAREVEGKSLTGPAAEALSMMIRGEAGPLTVEQSRAGFETVQESLLTATRVGIGSRKDHRAEERHFANRVRTPQGADLSADVGTRLRDEFELPVMSGTSGSSSDVALAARHSAEAAGLPWQAPGLEHDEARTAMVDLALQFFRTDGSAPSVALAGKMNADRLKQGLPAKEVEAHQVFSHSYAEIHSGVTLTLDGVSPKDAAAVEAAMKESTLEARQRLADA